MNIILRTHTNLCTPNQTRAPIRHFCDSIQIDWHPNQLDQFILHAFDGDFCRQHEQCRVGWNCQIAVDTAYCSDAGMCNNSHACSITMCARFHFAVLCVYGWRQIHFVFFIKFSLPWFYGINMIAAQIYIIHIPRRVRIVGIVLNSCWKHFGQQQ